MAWQSRGMDLQAGQRAFRRSSAAHDRRPTTARLRPPMVRDSSFGATPSVTLLRCGTEPEDSQFLEEWHGLAGAIVLLVASPVKPAYRHGSRRCPRTLQRLN